jgi:UDP-N-acetylglucosamine diphosphorylase/glucosamine-1-phosphate N-acetyltransferase
MNIILADYNRQNLLPFTFIRPVAEIRCGILTISEKWNRLSNTSCSYLTEPYLAKKFPIKTDSINFVANAAVLINKALFHEVALLTPGQALTKNDMVIAVCTTQQTFNTLEEIEFNEAFETNLEVNTLTYPWDIFRFNEKALLNDFGMITEGRKSQMPHASNTIINAPQVFIEEGAVVTCSVLNAISGPIYIGRNAEVMEGSLIRGPFALCNDSVLKMGAKIYGATTIGPGSKVGGEVNNAVIFGYSNKAHDGFLGNAVIGEWCNLGADTNNSNLKNNYGLVKAYNYPMHDYINTGLQFCGLMMGDHSKAAINTMFNTGTVVGICANIFGGGFPPKFIPSFAWGGFDNDSVFQLDKSIELAKQVYARRNMEFEKQDEDIMSHVNMLELRLPKI